MSDEAKSVWTPKEQALLVELQERKTRITAENMQRLADALGGCTESGSGNYEVAEFLAADADKIVSALKPFCSVAPGG